MTWESSRASVPDHTMEALTNYFNHGWEPGSFLRSVLVNDLYGAVARADHINREAIPNIVTWIVNNAPYGSWGSEEAFRDWVKHGVYFQRYEKQRVVDILSTP